MSDPSDQAEGEQDVVDKALQLRYFSEWESDDSGETSQQDSNSKHLSREKPTQLQMYRKLCDK
jgi:hypothetical protein